MIIQVFAIYLLSGIVFVAVLFSWFLMLTGRFKPWFFPPLVKEKHSKMAFLIQSLLLVMTALIFILRMDQLKNEHSDNVIENVIYGTSSLLLFRVIGDFKSFGLFGKEAPSKFRYIETRYYIPLFLVLFILSLFLVVG